MNQSKLLSTVISIDATNCYNRIDHLVVSLACRHFSLELSYLLVLFETIQTIEMYLRMEFKVSETFYTGTVYKPF